jgi:hypothetical protein
MARSVLSDINLMKQLSGVDSYTIPVKTVIAKVRSISVKDRRRLISVSRRALLESKVECSQAEEIRVFATRVLVAGAPLSGTVIEEVLARRKSKRDFENLFSMFCVLEHLCHMPQTQTLRKRVLAMVEDFLASVRSNTAHAAWMAGDLLGDHWPEKDAISILKRIAVEGRYAAGRDAAVSGLGTAIRRREIPAKDKGEFRLLLEQAAMTDRSKHVRLGAKIALKTALK